MSGPPRLRLAAISSIAALLCGCAHSGADTTAGENHDPAGANLWVRAHRDAMDTFTIAVAAIVKSVESNDMGLFSDGPQRCAESAATLASAADSLPSDERHALHTVAEACARIAGPAYMLDSAGVMAGLDPLFIALGTLTPIFDAADELS